MQRIMVVGSPGAGKSTFARTLADKLDLPLIHLDAEYWRSGWVEPPPAEWQAKLETLIAHESWVIDGNYGSSMDRRLARADTAIWLDYPTRVSLARAIGRVWRHRGRTRPDMAEGCVERFDLSFLRYIASFRRMKRPAIVRRLKAFTGTVVQLRTPAEAERWLVACLGAAAPRG